MLFNSIEFAIFLPVVFLLYWYINSKSLKLTNLFVVISSYIFYGWWDWRFLILIFLSTLCDYITGLKIHSSTTDSSRKKWLYVSIFFNLGMLGFFKYYNFFVESFISAYTLFGTTPNISSFRLILPIGISFYTFQTMSYTIDVYRRKFEPTKDFVSFSAFVSFFPLLVAGPIERAANLLPQFYQKRVFSQEKAADGLRQILWGLFKKIIIADGCAVYVTYAFSNYQDLSGSSLILGIILFTFQVYGDFSGYSDIAIGTARLLGFNPMRNFAYPFFSRDIVEFWRRWHISLTTWFRDYLYYPLGGSRGTKTRTIINTFIIFFISGLWHGASWTYVIWGMINGALFVPILLLNKNRNYQNIVAYDRKLPTIKEVLQMVFTVFCFNVSLALFRAENLKHALHYFKGILNMSAFSLANIHAKDTAIKSLIVVVIMIIIEWMGRRDQYGLEKFGLTWKRPLRWAVYMIIFIMIINYGLRIDPQDFVYFQF